MRRWLAAAALAWACESPPHTVDPAIDLGLGDAVVGVEAGRPDAGLVAEAGRDAGRIDAGAPVWAPEAAAPGPQGAAWQGAAVDFRLWAGAAERVELWIYAEARGPVRARVALIADEAGGWSARVPAEVLGVAEGAPVLYGYRVWGPNWPFDAAWAPGTEVGFVADVDAEGNRFNPNKLLIDPFARELSHDPWTPPTDGRVYGTGEHRARDSGPDAAKSVVLPDEGPTPARPAAPTRPFRDEIIYEVHLRGLTMLDPEVPEALRGTYAGAALKAEALAALGVTAVELLPIHETQNDQNDLELGADGDNYWGYSTLSYFAPDRRFAADQSLGGPTRELRAMVDAFHAAGLKVYADVVYNHTAEGGTWGQPGTAALLSWRGVDNAAYYQISDGGAGYQSHNGVGPNLRFTSPQVVALVLESLTYGWQVWGLDGYRFDLASVLGNTCDDACFRFGHLADGVLVQAAERFARPAAGGVGLDLIAEPWGVGEGTYQVGAFPLGWAEWNDRYRDLVRDAQNRPGQGPTPGSASARVHGSSALFRDGGRQPWHSVNFVVAHDGLTLADLYACDDRRNDQPWPFGPSDGGSGDNRAWDQGGAPTDQRQAARTGLAVLMLSAGVPMMLGGDELLRSRRCNNNGYNLDSEANWLPGALSPEQAGHRRFTEALLRFRQAHPALRPARWTEGVDRNGDGVADVTWLRADGAWADAAYLDDGAATFLAWRLDGTEVGDAAASIYVAWSWGGERVAAYVPPARAGHRWVRAFDTAAWAEPMANHDPPGEPEPLNAEGRYDLAPRSVFVALEVPR